MTSLVLYYLLKHLCSKFNLDDPRQTFFLNSKMIFPSPTKKESNWQPSDKKPGSLTTKQRLPHYCTNITTHWTFSCCVKILKHCMSVCLCGFQRHVIGSVFDILISLVYSVTTVADNNVTNPWQMFLDCKNKPTLTHVQNTNPDHHCTHDLLAVTQQ